MQKKYVATGIAFTILIVASLAFTYLTFNPEITRTTTTSPYKTIEIGRTIHRGYDSLGELIGESELVVLGKVVRLDKTIIDNGREFHYFAVNVNRSLYGCDATNSEILVRYDGSFTLTKLDGGVSSSLSESDLTFQIGDQWVLFLNWWSPPTDSQLVPSYLVTGATYGKLKVVDAKVYSLNILQPETISMNVDGIYLNQFVSEVMAATPIHTVTVKTTYITTTEDLKIVTEVAGNTTVTRTVTVADTVTTTKNKTVTTTGESISIGGVCR